MNVQGAHAKQFWLTKGPSSDIIVSTRVRLARNFSDIPFPDKCEDKDLARIEEYIHSFVQSNSGDAIQVISLIEMDNLERRYLREQNLITLEMEKKGNSYLLVSEEKGYSILVCEEDHIRIQVIRPGLQLFEAFKVANIVDDDINIVAPYAFHTEFGYLTTCASNLGTGLKLSVIMHLPMLAESNRVSDLDEKYGKKGFSLKPTVSSETNIPGYLYLLSNRISLGISEIDIIETMDHLVSEILHLEDEARDSYIQTNRVNCEDRIWRSHGILNTARILSYPEAMEHISNLRLGVYLGVIRSITMEKLNDMMVSIQFSHLQKSAAHMLRTQEEIDIARANYLREVVGGSHGED